MATLAPALFTLRAQLDFVFPARSTASDGWIASAEHLDRTGAGAAASQHNPNADDVVCAIDVTEHLAVGLDCMRLLDELDASGDPRFFYGIHDGLIENSDDTRTPYRGSNKHVVHLHVSTDYRRPDLYNDGRLWNLPMLGGTPARPAAPARPAPSVRPVLRLGSTGSAVSTVQNRLRNSYPAYRHDVAVKRGRLLTVDGDFGAQTDAWVRELQERSRLKVDGVVGPATYKALQL